MGWMDCVNSSELRGSVQMVSNIWVGNQRRPDGSLLLEMYLSAANMGLSLEYPQSPFVYFEEKPFP